MNHTTLIKLFVRKIAEKGGKLRFRSIKLVKEYETFETLAHDDSDKKRHQENEQGRRFILKYVIVERIYFS